MSLGQRIKERRKSLGITQRELADILEVTPQHISAVEQDKRTPSLPFLVRLAERLGVTMDFLITGREEVLPGINAMLRADESLPIEARKALTTIVRALHEKTGH